MPVEFFPFAQYTPDLGRLGNPGLLNAENVAPLYDQGFVPIPAINVFHEDQGGGYFPLIVGGAPETSVSKYALGGAHVFLPTDETWYKVFAATMSAISSLEQRVFLTEVQFDKDGTVTAASATLLGGAGESVQREGWFFVTYGNSVIFVGGDDIIPKIIVDATAALGVADLWSASSPKEPYAKYVGVIGFHLLLANIKEGGTSYPNRVWWSKTDDVRFYSDAATDPSARTGYQDLNDEYGKITGCIGGSDYAYIAKEGCWYRMDFGGPFDFSFKPFGIGMGTIYGHSICKFGETIYYWSKYGPARIRPGLEPEPLGNGVFGRSLRDGSWVLENPLGLYPDSPAHRVIACVDEENELVIWAYNSQNSLEEDADWLWVVDTAFLFNTRHGRGAVVRNWFDTETLQESGAETGIQNEAANAVTTVDPEAVYPADWRPSWPIFVPAQANLAAGFDRWAPLLRVQWFLSSKGYESSGNNAFGWALACSDNTTALVARFRTGFIRLDGDGGADVQIKGVRPYFSINHGGTEPQVEMRLSSLLKPSGTPTEALVATRPDDRGWFSFPRAINAPLHQFDLRILNPTDVGEIKGIEVEWDFAGARR